MTGSQFISLKRGSFWLSNDAIGLVELPSIRDCLSVGNWDA